MDMDATRRYSSFRLEPYPKEKKTDPRKSLSFHSSRGRSLSPKQSSFKTPRQMWGGSPSPDSASSSYSSLISNNTDNYHGQIAADKHQQILDLQQELRAVRRELAKEVREKDSLKWELRRAQTGIENQDEHAASAKLEIKKLEREVQLLEEANDKKQREIATLTTDLRIVRVDHKCLQARFEEQREQLTEALKDAAKVPQLTADLEDKDLTESALRINRKKATELEIKLDKTKDHMNSLETTIEDQSFHLKNLEKKNDDANYSAQVLTRFLKEINGSPGQEISLGKLAEVEVVSDILKPLWKQLRMFLQHYSDLTFKIFSLSEKAEKYSDIVIKEKDLQTRVSEFQDLALTEGAKRKSAESKLRRRETQHSTMKEDLKELESFIGALGLALHSLPELPDLGEDMQRFEGRWPPKLSLILAAFHTLIRSWKNWEEQSSRLYARLHVAERQAEEERREAAETCQALVSQTEKSLRALQQTCACKAVQVMNGKKSRRKSLNGKFSPVRSTGCNQCKSAKFSYY